MPRVLLLIKGLGRGGAERLVVGCARLGRRFEYEVAYCLPWKDALVPDLTAAGIPVHCLGADARRWARRLRSLVRERRVDLVHAHSPAVAVAARVTLPSSVPILYTEHNVWPRYRPATRWGNAVTFSRNAHVFAVSQEVANSIRYPPFLRWLPLPPVEPLVHGIDPARVAGWGQPDGARRELGIPDGVPVVTSIANFKPHKGHAHLVRAAQMVRRAVPEARFVLVGAGPLEREVRRQVVALGLEGAVVFTGSREDAPRIAAASDVFLLASEHEGLPIALLEAMAMGCPVVATRVGGVPEVVRHGRDGLIVPPSDSAASAEAVTCLLLDPELRRSMGEAARGRAAQFDLRVAVGRIEDVYEGLLERRAGKKSESNHEEKAMTHGGAR
ncbi:MAG TPA: glycosyltransferase [Actinomycetota bacterium]|nr:glycosyltransferase [Actinomycetota bacterium]